MTLEMFLCVLAAFDAVLLVVLLVLLGIMRAQRKRMGRLEELLKNTNEEGPGQARGQ